MPGRTIFPVTPAANEKNDLSSLAAFCLPETRVWGPRPENAAFIGSARWLSSTSRWGCQYRCDGTVSGRLVGLDYAKNRYYSNTLGRFLTPDPYTASVGPADPGSWNRYAYTRGDPVNRKDPSGMDDENGDAPNYDTGVPGAGCVLGDCRRLPYKYLSPGQIDPETVAKKPKGTMPTVPWFDPTTLNNWSDAYNAALQDLAKADCAKHFNTSGGGMNPVAALQSAGGASNGNAQLFFGTTTQQGISGYAYWQGTYTVSNASYYYGNIMSTRGTIEINVASWNSQTLQSDTATLIHELGHLYDMVQGLGGSDFVYDANPDGSPNSAAEQTNAALVADCTK